MKRIAMGSAFAETTWTDAFRRVRNRIALVAAAICVAAAPLSSQAVSALGSISDVAHVDRTKITRSVEDLKQNELLPFQTAVDKQCGFVIVSHAVLTELDDQRPCSMSPAVMQLLRDDLGYRGIILTDTLSVPAITEHYDSGEAALNAINAGADMLLCPKDLEETIEALQKAVEENKLTEERIDESVTRILAAKLRLGLIE